MSRTALKRTCMRDQIRDALVARILDGSYPPGMQLKELALAREFNVSQAPIREALRELEGTGLVACERFRGTRVRGADFNELRDSYELRGLLEVRSVELAAPYGDALIAALEHCLSEMRAASAAGALEHYIDQALRFHRRLLEASGNRTFLLVWDSMLWDVRGRIALRRLLGSGEDLAPLIELHRALIASLRAQDTTGAARLVRSILTRVAASFDTQ